MNAPVRKEPKRKGGRIKPANSSPQAHKALIGIMEKIGRKAAARGLTDEKLDRILVGLKQKRG